MEFCTIWKSELLVFEMEISWFLQAHLKSPVWVQSPDVKLTRLISMSRSCMPCPAVRVRAGNSTVPLGTSHHREDVPKDFWRQNLFYCLILETRLPSNTYLLAPVLESSLLLDQTAAHLHWWWESPILTLLLLLRPGATLKAGVENKLVLICSPWNLLQPAQLCWVLNKTALFILSFYTLST